MDGNMISYLLLVATVAFAGLALLFFVHYRKMIDLEIALSRSETREKSLQTSLDNYSNKYEKIIKYFSGPNTTEEKISYISKLIGD
jgi:hypothetical protein